MLLGTKIVSEKEHINIEVIVNNPVMLELNGKNQHCIGHIPTRQGSMTNDPQISEAHNSNTDSTLPGLQSDCGSADLHWFTSAGPGQAGIQALG